MAIENKKQFFLIGFAVVAGIAATVLTSNYVTSSIEQKTQELHDQYEQQQKQISTQMQQRSEQQNRGSRFHGQQRKIVYSQRHLAGRRYGILCLFAHTTCLPAFWAQKQPIRPASGETSTTIKQITPLKRSENAACGVINVPI